MENSQRACLVRVYPWENPRWCETEVGVKEGDSVVVSLDYCVEMGRVKEITLGYKGEIHGKIGRLASIRDKEAHAENEKKKEEFLRTGKEELKEIDLPMKLIDCAPSLDGKQITYAFIAEGRVDFRELVKRLSEKFKASIRMQQIGSRDEARKIGGYGMCGRELCCVRFGGTMQSITTEMARSQQLAHRGSERISGLCGRLMCCLAYEADQYRELLKGMPEIYSTVETAKGKGTVVEINAISQEVKLKLGNGEYVVVGKHELATKIS